jgi:hypothetical protein
MQIVHKNGCGPSPEACGNVLSPNVTFVPEGGELQVEVSSMIMACSHLTYSYPDDKNCTWKYIYDNMWLSIICYIHQTFMPFKPTY